jgi:hypothetical protein
MQNAVRADLFLRSLALAVARNAVGANLDINEVLKSEGIQLSEYQDIEKNPTYQGYLSKYKQELVESGFSFEAKCKLLAEDMLPGFYHLGRDPDTPAPVRAKVMEQMVKWANLEPKNDVSLGGSGGFSINIVLPSDSGGETTTITAEIQAKELSNGSGDEKDAIEGEFDDVSGDDNAPDEVKYPKLTTGDILSAFFEESEDYQYAGDDVYE